MYLIINGKPPSQTEKKYVAVHLNELLLFISNPAIFFSYIMVRTSYFEWDDDELRFVLDLHGWLDFFWL